MLQQNHTAASVHQVRPWTLVCCPGLEQKIAHSGKETRKKLKIAAASLAVMGTLAALAGGLDRSGQSIVVLFEQGTLFTANFSYAIR